MSKWLKQPDGARPSRTDAIAEYIALDNPAAASHLVQEVFDKTGRLEDFPNPDGFSRAPDSVQGGSGSSVSHFLS